MNIKYLGDGRKVVVIGEVNKKETIVQEIFVTEDGDEIPSGEKFITKSLHDEPVISYKEKEEKKREKRIEALAEKEKQHIAETDNILWQLKAYREILKNVKKFIDLIPESELDTFTGFLTGTIKYIVVEGYRIKAPQEFIDKVIQWDTWGSKSYDGIKLLSVFGKSGGDLEYRIHQYSDSSGGHDTVKLFETFNEAVEHIKKLAVEKIAKESLSEADYNTCLELGIKFNKADENKYKEARKKELIMQVDRLNNEVEYKKSEIKKLLKSVKED